MFFATIHFSHFSAHIICHISAIIRFIAKISNFYRHKLLRNKPKAFELLFGKKFNSKLSKLFQNGTNISYKNFLQYKVDYKCKRLLKFCKESGVTFSAESENISILVPSKD
jgi:hypothetical protein